MSYDYGALIGINEADIHHECVTAHQPDSRGLWSRRIRDPINVVLLEKPQKKGVETRLVLVMNELLQH